MYYVHIDSYSFGLMVVDGKQYKSDLILKEGRKVAGAFHLTC
jgi:hypothetical protein